MKCSSCGREIITDSIYCQHCGVKIRNSQGDKTAESKDENKKSRSSKWWVYHVATKQTYGPADKKTVNKWIEEKRITSQDYIAEVGTNEWVLLDRSPFTKVTSKDLTLGH
jgi:hypothetical protein